MSFRDRDQKIFLVNEPYKIKVYDPKEFKLENSYYVDQSFNPTISNSFT
jgi:hypothetical protein